jgi:hypothetical protein
LVSRPKGSLNYPQRLVVVRTRCDMPFSRTKKGAFEMRGGGGRGVAKIRECNIATLK